MNAPASPVASITATTVLHTIFWSQLNQLLTIVTSIFLARYLGAHGRGLLAAAILWPSIVANLGLLGILPVLTTRIRSNPLDIRTIAGEALCIGFVLGLLEAVALFFLMPFLLPDSANEVLYWSKFYIIILPISHIGIVINHLFLAMGRTSLSGLHVLCFNAVYLICLAGFHFSRALTFHWALISIMIAVLVSVLVSASYFILSIQPERRFSADLIQKGFPFWLDQCAGTVSQKVEQIVIVAMMQPAALGYYVLAQSFAGIAGGIAASVNAVVFVKLTDPSVLATQGSKLIGDIFRQSLVAQFMIMCVLFALAPIVIPAMFSRSFEPSIFPARMLLIGTLFKAQSDLLLAVARAQGKTRVTIAFQLAAGCVLGIATYLLVPQYGLTGCAVAFTCVQALVLFALIGYMAIQVGSVLPFVFITHNDVIAVFARIKNATPWRSAQN